MARAVAEHRLAQRPFHGVDPDVERPAGLHEARERLVGGGGIRGVVDHAVAEHEVEALGPQRRRQDAALHDGDARSVERHAGHLGAAADVEADHLGPHAREGPQVASVAAAGVQHALARIPARVDAGAEARTDEVGGHGLRILAEDALELPVAEPLALEAATVRASALPRSASGSNRGMPPRTAKPPPGSPPCPAGQRRRPAAPAAARGAPQSGQASRGGRKGCMDGPGGRVLTEPGPISRPKNQGSPGPVESRAAGARTPRVTQPLCFRGFR